MAGVNSGEIIISGKEQRRVELKKHAYYDSTVDLIKILSILSVLALGAILIFHSKLEQVIDTYYIKSATIALWICVIGCGLSYYNIVSNYKKSIKMFGIEEPNQTESINRARLFGSTRFEYLSVIPSICMLAFGFWFSGLFILLGLLNT